MEPPRLNWLRLNVLFSTPDWLTLMRSTAMIRSSGVRNHAVCGESGKANLERETGIQRHGRTWIVRRNDVPESNGNDQCYNTSEDHEPLPRHELVSMCMKEPIRHKTKHDDSGAIHKD